MEIGSEIRKWREARGISQLRLAYLAKISQSHMCRIEKDEQGDIRLSTLRRIAAALEITPLQLAPELAGRAAPPQVMPPRVRLRGGESVDAEASSSPAQIHLVLGGLREAAEQRAEGILTDTEHDAIRSRLLQFLEGAPETEH